VEVAVAELQPAVLVVREAQPDRQAVERRVVDLEPVRKAGLEHKVALERKAELIMAQQPAVRRAKAALALRETKMQLASKMASRAAETLAHVIKTLRIHSATRPQVAQAVAPVCLPAILVTALTAMHKADKQQVAVQRVPASLDFQTM